MALILSLWHKHILTNLKMVEDENSQMSRLLDVMIVLPLQPEQSVPVILGSLCARQSFLFLLYRIIQGLAQAGRKPKVKVFTSNLDLSYFLLL